MKRITGIILCIVLISLCITQDITENPVRPESTTPVSPGTKEPTSSRTNTPFGICTNPQLYQYLPQLGASWTFTGILWEDIEPEQDVWTFEKADQIIHKAQSNNITVIVKIRTGTCWATKNKTDPKTSSPPESLEDYADFVYTVVDRYKEYVDYWGVENEMNSKQFWNGTLEEYNQIIETAYAIIKEVDPSAQVLDSGLASMTYGTCIAREFYEQGDTDKALRFFNEYYKRRGLSVSSEQELKEVIYAEDAETVYTIMMDHFTNPYYDVYQLHYYEDYQLLDEVIQFIKKHVPEEKPIFAVEMGYACVDDGSYNTTDHGEDTVKLMVSLLAEGIFVQIYLPLIDLDEDGREVWRGLVSPDKEKRPALYGYHTVTALLAGKEFTQPLESEGVLYEFENVVVAWSQQQILIPVTGTVVVIDIYGNRETKTDTVTVGQSPLFIVKTGYKSNDVYTKIDDNIKIVEFPSYDGVLVEGFLAAPEGDTFPAVVLVHGGTSSREAAINMVKGIGVLFTQKGYVALAVHYRDGPLGLQDVEDTIAAIEFLKTLDYVDSDRIGVYGGSHGGYIALMCAWKTDVKAVVEAAGFCDLGSMADTLLTRRGEWYNIMIDFYGGTPDEVPEQYQKYSPCGHVEAFTAPVFIIHGKMDNVVPAEHAYRLQELLELYKKPYEIYLSETGEHGFYHKKSKETETVWELIFAFFDKYLKSS